jgi:hypothetical protein
MDAGEVGFGLVIPTPRFFFPHLGTIVYLDEQGVVRTVGRLLDDAHFQKLAEKFNHPLEQTTSTEDGHPGLTVALTTYGIGVSPLTKDECSV